MESVSEAWKENQKRTLTTQAYISISFDLDDPKGYSDGTVSDNGKASFADNAGILLKSPIAPTKVGTFERNLFVLDGTLSVPKSSYSSDDVRRGYVGSALSNADGTFSTSPQVIISFASVHSQRITGMTIKFGESYENEYPISFSLYATENGSEVLIEAVTNNASSTWSIEGISVSDYSRLRLVFFKWSLPNRRARLSNIFLGVKMNYYREQLTSYSETRKSDPLLASLPSFGVSFSVDNTDGKFNPNDENSAFNSLSQRQKIFVQCGFERINGKREVLTSGSFYLSSWEVKQNSLVASFVANDLLSFLTDKYYGGYSDLSKKASYSLGSLLTSILTELVNKGILPTLDGGASPFYVDSALNSIYTEAPIPACSYKDAILYLAQAGGAAVTIERSGRINVSKKVLTFSEGKLAVQGDYVIDAFKQYEYPELSLQKPLAEIDVNVYSYHFGVETDGTTLKVEDLYNGSFTIATAGTYEYTFVFSKMGEVTAVSGGTLVSSSNNSCVVSIVTTSVNETVTIVVKGHTIEKSSVVYSLVNSSVDKSQGLVESVSNPLITNISSAQAVASWLLSYLKDRKTYTAKFRIDPRLDPLDQIGVEDKYGNEEAVLVTDESVKYQGSFHGTAKGKVITQ